MKGLVLVIVITIFAIFSFCSCGHKVGEKIVIPHYRTYGTIGKESFKFYKDARWHNNVMKLNRGIRDKAIIEIRRKDTVEIVGFDDEVDAVIVMYKGKKLYMIEDDFEHSSSRDKMDKKDMNRRIY